MKPRPLTFKIASEADEFTQIHRLNYETFVEEIPQHPANPSGSLQDKFHEENTYLIALRDTRVVGMVAVRDRRPFSLDAKLPNLDSYLPIANFPCEVRLLTVAPGERTGVVFRGLLSLLSSHCNRQGYDLVIISGTTRQQKLYRHLGFTPFGLPVGSPEALYQPMFLTPASFKANIKPVLNRLRNHLQKNSILPDEQCNHREPVSLLPGPVNMTPAVREAFAAPPLSHRSQDFIEMLAQTQQALQELTQAYSANIMVGTGTLANDIIAAQLSLQAGHGLILSNGEFGNRLLDHATRCGLSYHTLAIDWGASFDRDLVEAALDDQPASWLWAVHCETSTGVLNELPMLQTVCAERGIRLCLDCVSSIGTVALDLSQVYLAAGSSGKGLAAYPGLAIVFSNHPVAPAPQRLPRYLDLGLYATGAGSPFTHSSNLLAALSTALAELDSRRYRANRQLAAWLRESLRARSFDLIAPDANTSPAVTTIALPRHVCSEDVGHRMEAEGYTVSYLSGYLLQRNWIQICLMGECHKEAIARLPDLLHRICFATPATHRSINPLLEGSILPATSLVSQPAAPILQG